MKHLNVLKDQLSLRDHKADLRDILHHSNLHLHGEAVHPAVVVAVVAVAEEAALVEAEDHPDNQRACLLVLCSKQAFIL